MNRHPMPPPLSMRADDHEKLTALVSVACRDEGVCSFLADELARANVVEPRRLASGVVTMDSVISFRDEKTGRIRRVTLVYPNREDVLSGRLSVLTPIGAALIGLSVGSSIEWQARDGERRRLTVLSVQSQAAVEEERV